MAEASCKEAVQEKTLCKQGSSDCVDSEVRGVLGELVDKVSEQTICGQEVKEDPSSDISSFVEMDETESNVQNEDSSENEIPQTVLKQRSHKKRTRSVSENASEEDTKSKEISRRKFGSEGAVLSMGEKILLPEQRKELNEAIEQYIEKLVKDSIFKAVKRVSVDDLYEDIIKEFSVRQNSLNAESENDFIVEQRLSSHSISELVELENTADSEYKCGLSLLPRDNDRVSEMGTFGGELDDGDHATFVGYLADLEDTASIDDLKSTEESFNSLDGSSNLGKGILRFISQVSSEKSCENTNQTEPVSKDFEIHNEKDVDLLTKAKTGDSSPSEEVRNDQQQELSSSDTVCYQNKSTVEQSKDLDSTQLNTDSPSKESSYEQNLSPEGVPESNENLQSTEKADNKDPKPVSSEINDENIDLIVMSPEEECLPPKGDSKTDENTTQTPDIIDSPPQQAVPPEEQTKVNWKVGCLHVKLPHKTRGKAALKAWKKRRVVIQPDEFVNDPKNPSLVISVYGNDSKKHETTFWHSVSSQKAVVFRSSSRTHRYAFTISDGGEPIIHLSADKETTTQEWMASVRAVLWPPSPFMELEKMLSGREFEISIIDNEYSYHAGLLGMYGYLSITPKKLILLHPQQGYVIQEWYLNTVDKFHFVPQPKPEDMHKVLCMTTCRDSSTGQGEIVFYCSEAVTFLQSLASNIHQVLSYHSKQEGGKYRKELEEIAEWLVAPPQDCLTVDDSSDEHYKVPPRQVKSLLDIPNFIFNKSLSPVASAIYPAPNTDVMEPLDGTKNKPTTTSHDSGISTCTSGEDFLNCSVTSFVLGGGPMTGKSSDSELSDAYTPPRTPEIKKKTICEVLKEELPTAGEA